ncbi:Uma2 family endonuclease [Pannus brasiliensis CCIBt3594]|uniref:Uma2 family endonuclease n=1 Tax=Pannus brasiliensis CCIBt3594 TaxID=1427578 RepID=A0AAW9QRE5_9CHRO
MTTTPIRKSPSLPAITWEKLPEDFILPDDPADNLLQPLFAAALRESLELAGLILESMIIATNFGICATVDDKIVVKAPDWVYIPSVIPVTEGAIRRSYTPCREGDLPLVVLEFVSETEGGEYSINPHYPYGKWYFYERILQVPIYGIFHPKTGDLEFYRLVSGKYEQQVPDENHRYRIEEMNLFLGVWQGKKAENTAYWLRWWDSSGNLLLWGSERLEQERERAEQAERELDRERIARQQLAEKLREMGVDPENL